MAKKESVHKKLDKVRPPRVQLTYDVQIGEAQEQKEIPFVAGVLGDFTGKQDPDNPLPKLKDRKFVGIDLDNFDDVMGAMAPAATFRVKNRMQEEGGEFAVNLKFRKMDDFRPEAVVEQVEPLKKLLEARTRLADLRNKLAGNEKLEDLLGDVLNSTEKLKTLGKESNQGEA